MLLTIDNAIGNCHLCLLPWFLSLRFCFMSPSWEFTFLMKSFRFSFISWGHPFLLTPSLSSLGKKENTTQKKLSPRNFHHLNSLRWKGYVAGGHCFLPGSKWRLPWSLCSLGPKVWELGRLLEVFSRARLPFCLCQCAFFLTKFRNREGYFW